MEISSSSHWEVPTVLYKELLYYMQGLMQFLLSIHPKDSPLAMDQTQSSQVSQQILIIVGDQSMVVRMEI